ARPRARRPARGPADRAAPPRGAPLVAGQPRALRDRRAAARDGGGETRPTYAKSERRPSRGLDGNGLARHDGERRAKRADCCRLPCVRSLRESSRMTIAPQRTLSALDTTIDLGVERLLSLQHPDGYWVGELESNATMIAQ